MRCYENSEEKLLNCSLTRTSMRRVLLTNLNWCRSKDPTNALGGASIEAVLKQENLDYISSPWNVKDKNFNWKDVVEFSMEHADKDTDFAIGGFIWNETYTQKIIRQLKGYKFPGRIIVGGPQVSYTKRNLEQYYPNADLFIRGYGEKALAQVLKGKKVVKGLHIAGEPDLSMSADVSLEDLPSPFLTGIIKAQKFIRWETQRGCPFHCSFCQHRESDVSMKRKLFAKQRIAQEIKWICSNPIIQDIAVLDPTFNSGSLYLNVLQMLTELKYSGKIALQCRLEMCSEEFLNSVIELNKSARVVLEFGIQTIHKDEQKLIQRFNNLKKAERVMERLNENKIETEISLIFGLPGQTLNSFKASVAWCQKVNPTKIMAFPLMLLRGTLLYEQRKELGLIESCEIAHPAIERIQEEIPHVVESPTFSYSDWTNMANIAVSINK